MSRYTKIGADGAHLPADAADHVAVLDTTTGLMWSARNVGSNEQTHEAAERSCQELELAGFTDWRMPTVEELFALADRTRMDPAIDTEAFPDTESTWYWSSTPSAWSASCAWVVVFNFGLAGSLHRYSSACVRAVRVAAPAASGQ
jgi:hypothetical protein